MPTTNPETRQVDLLAGLTAGWEARVDNNFRRIAESIKTCKFTLITQGTIAAPSRVKIELVALDGAVLSASAAKAVYLRVRICNLDDGWLLHPTAFISSFHVGGGSEIEDMAPGTPDRDLIVKAGATGVVEFNVTLGIAGFFTVRTGPSTVGGTILNHHATRVVQHA
jgi:hypothetical protein